MKTKSLSYLAIAFFTLVLAGCGASINPASPTSAIPPMATDTMPPESTVTPAPTSPPTVDVKIQGFAFDPSSITIKAGTTVRWTNMDGVSHSVTDDSGAWDSGGLAQGDSFTRVFDTPGTFTYHCGVHPNMKATIIVTA
jgi:plastocyanin